MGFTILIADDDPERLERARRLAWREGADAVTASDAREVMRLFILRKPTVTVLHVDPSIGLTIELCREMKTLGVGHSCAVVVVAPSAARSASFQAGCDAFFDCRSGDQPALRTVRRILASHRKPRRHETIAVSS